ncbi:DUF4982 domain-containing protein [Selenomonas sp.]|uniref:DUF4982 domain-containing protein n=1 Tax=Selenomonas sp. TaxID=2053611 RepID=UPI0025E68848|nr:DUF4982 domain-containing protein [Selenomonas sp.]MCI6283298.1 DUF4982 domain-containing protein [Selenomonas sp.]
MHLLPSWERDRWQEGETVPVWAYTNAASVELYLNGRSLGTQHYDPNGAVLHLAWDVPYTPGELKAVARDENGKEIAKDVIRTSTGAASIRLTADAKSVKDDGKDLVYITADIVDDDGDLVANADNLVSFHVTGGTVVGVDNGDGASFEPYKGTRRKAFHGKCLAIVQPDGSKGEMIVTASNWEKKLTSNEVRVRVKK